MKLRWGVVAGMLIAAFACGEDETSSDDDATSATSASSSGSGGASGCGEMQYACDSGCCDCPAPGVMAAQQLGQPVARAVGGDVDGDGSSELVVAWSGGGVAVFSPSSCGGFERSVELGGVAPNGIALGLLDQAAGVDLALFTGDFTLSAYDGVGTDALWSEVVTGLSTPGDAITAHLDSDGDHDVAVFDAANANLLRVENTGSGWMVRVAVSLPAGIAQVRAGDLGGGARDELLFLGGGLVEVLSVADFDFSDVRFLSQTAHGDAAFGDFDGDGTGDAAVTAGSSVELWRGSSSGLAAMSGTTALDGAAIAIASAERDGAAPAEAVVVSDSGTVQLLGSGSLAAGEQASAAPDAIAVIAGDVDGDGRDDVVVVGADGRAHVWRTP